MNGNNIIFPYDYDHEQKPKDMTECTMFNYIIETAD